jgi:hypothetical protein
MNKFTALLAASVIAVTATSPALAGWNSNSVRDPAFGSSTDRQLEAAAQRLSPQAAQSSSAISTNDAVTVGVGQKTWFGGNLDRAVESQDSPYNN